ncbi:HNH endonuclease signature motif containing protein [Aeromicrobium fastidiosum]|uniref:HNH endonuclease n=1 Tax=Aeromicrobium fastidiosum TaxID=52699 RepID=A0A641AKS6_9ACTN|nr:HNH endonuclease signature motif containing protein [Aeromicrobium fastidiosum]KAA1376286.1 HNH endonuclease [Aeromicrobium fastidiosum]MBP2391818.1 hypothetical protein [Aeromicrobium fastidiosum]
MFETMAPGRVLDEVRGFDFDALPVIEAGHERVEAIKALDRAARAAQAEQVRQIVALLDERTQLMVGAGDPCLSVIGEVSMARMIGPTAAGTQLELAMGMDRLPQVFALFADGTISEATARAVARETQSLHVDDMVVADAEIAGKIVGMTTVQARQCAARVVIGIDAEAAYERSRRNRADARVTMAPEADGVATMIVRGPAEQILAAYKTLDDWATGLRSTGDPRTRGQIMCQTLVERVTGLAYADGADVELQLVLDAKTLLAGPDGDTPVELTGYGPIAPDVADDIIARAKTASVRRLLVDPVDGTLLVREKRRRRFDRTTSAHVRARDKYCRQPGCDLAIRDDDHIRSHQHAGPSIADNAQGLCKRSHTIKHQPGWQVTGDGKITKWTTPTGHTYTSTPPPVLPGRDLGHLRQ